MAKLVFRAEVRLPKQIVLPLLVARAAESERTITIRDREIEVAEPVAEFLQQRHPTWLESKPATPSDDEQPLPKSKLDRMTISQLQKYAAEWGIDLGDATKHDDIVDVIFKALSDEGEADNPDAADSEPDEAADSSADGT